MTYRIRIIEGSVRLFRKDRLGDWFEITPYESRKIAKHAEYYDFGNKSAGSNQLALAILEDCLRNVYAAQSNHFLFRDEFLLNRHNVTAFEITQREIVHWISRLSGIL